MTAGRDNDGRAGRTAEEWKRSRPSVGDSCWRQTEVLEWGSTASRTRIQGDGRAGGRKQMCGYPRFLKLVELLVMVTNKGARSPSVHKIIFSSGNIICGVSSMDHIEHVCNVFIYQKTPFYQRSKLSHWVNVFHI